MDKTGRNGLRVGDIMSPDFEQKYNDLKEKHFQILKQYDVVEDITEWEKDFFASLPKLRSMNIVNAEYWLDEQLKQNKKILAEGAQGSMLDVDFGTYPFVTSSNTTVAGVCSGLGISAKYIDRVIGITKAYCTRVGSGPFPTELHDETGEQLRATGNEFGATTGRPRRCGWIDLVALKYACMISGVDTLVVTKADVLNEFEWLQVCTAYKINGVETTEFPYNICDAVIEPVYQEMRGWRRGLDDMKDLNSMPAELIKIIDVIELHTKARVKFVSNGVGRDQIVAI
jgi:adenylosuccinate synthase